jgi:hypothetical protein
MRKFDLELDFGRILVIQSWNHASYISLERARALTLKFT